MSLRNLQAWLVGEGTGAFPQESTLAVLRLIPHDSAFMLLDIYA